MQAGISNMEDIHELIIWNTIMRFVFMHFEKSCAKMSQNHTSNLHKVFLNVPPSSDFGLEARILQIGWFYRPKWKKVEKSASKNKHPIKLRFLIWRLQSANPEKKVIPENQRFGSCPFGPEIKCRIPFYRYGWIVPLNHVRKHDESIFRRGASFSQFFSYENFVKKIALKLLIKWTSNVFIKEKSRKVGSPPQYWFIMLSNIISWDYSSLPIIWDAAFYLMSKIFW